MKKITLSFMLFFAVYILTAQSIQFDSLTNMPVPRSGVCSATDGQFIYVVNGFSGENYWNPEIFKYDISLGTWSIFTDLTIGKHYASTAIIEDKLYVFNGNATKGVNDKVEIINLKDQSISFGQTTPYQSGNGGVATWEDKIYSFGGFIRTNQYSKKVFVYHTKKDQWKYVTDLPEGFETEGEIVSYNGEMSNKIYIFNLSTNKWEEPYEMPTGISAHTTAVDKNTIYIVGDYKNRKQIASFDTSTNQYKVLENNMKPRRHAAVEIIKGKLYVMGGNVESSINTAMQNVQVAKLPSLQLDNRP